MVTTVGQSQQREAPGVVLSLARYWRTSLLIVVVFAAAAFGVSQLLPERYAATATINLTDPRFRDIFSRQGALPQDLERFTASQADLVTSRRVFVEVTERVEGVTVGQLFRNVSTSAEREGAVDVRAEAGSAERAQDLATATAQAYGRVTAEETRQRTDEAVIAIQANRQDLLSTIAEIQSGLEDGDEGVSRTQLDSVTSVVAGLDQRISEIRINSDAFGDGIDYLEEARRPRQPFQPDPVRNAAAGGLFGLLAAGALAWFRADRHRAADESASAEAVLGTPMLGSIPELRSDADLAGVTDASSVAAESYQFVTASLQYVFKWGILLVTSAGRRDGKTVSAASMAAAAARDGTRVLLVDADARSRGLTRRLLGRAAEHTPGLTDLAEGSTDPTSAVRLLALPEGVTLPFVPAGSTAAGVGSLFRTQGMADAVAELRETYDLVVVDCPALLAVADVASLAVHADGMVLVVSRGTPLELLEAVRHRLELVPAPLIGCVFARTDGGHVTTAYSASPALPEHLAPGRRTRGGRRARSRRDEAAILFDNGNGVSSPNGHATSERAERQHGDEPRS